MIAIVDYGVGNLSSIDNALKKLGFESIVTDNPKEIEKAQGVILPGVGAFKDAMESLRQMGLDKFIVELAESGKPILGICLGMQVLYEKSYEDGEWEGLGILKGDVVKFESDTLKIPHMGWNSLIINKQDEIVKYISEGEYVYFVHSYYASPGEDHVVAHCDYGVKFPAMVAKGNVYGIQFHPEKSGKTGLNILKAFGEMIK